MYLSVSLLGLLTSLKDVSFLHIEDDKKLKQAEEKGLVEINRELLDEHQYPAVRLTEKGREVLEKAENPAKVEKEAFAIDDNVPIPALTRNVESDYPMKQLEIGQSFFVPNKEMLNIVSSQNRRNLKNKIPSRFVSRKVTENGVKGSRVWRVEDFTDKDYEAFERKLSEKQASSNPQ